MIKESKGSDASALTEAKSLVAAMRNGVDIRDALTISHETMATLNAFCAASPVDAYLVRNAIDFRFRVREYVNRLLAGEQVVVRGSDAEDEEGEEQASEVAESPIAEAALYDIPDEAEPIAQEAEA